jgi:hypothetical protein
LRHVADDADGARLGRVLRRLRLDDDVASGIGQEAGQATKAEAVQIVPNKTRQIASAMPSTLAVSRWLVPRRSTW